MTSSSELRKLWAPYLCNESMYGIVVFPGSGRSWNLKIAKPAVPAFEALSDLMGSHGYLFRESAGGSYNCRQIAGSDEYSLHAYAIALDLNPSKNAYGQCGSDMPPEFVEDVLALRTGNGAAVFSWGGNWRPCSTADPMHFQIDCSPADLETGIGDDMTAAEMREIMYEWFGAPIGIPDDPSRRTNQGIVNGVWHPVIYGEKAMDLLHEAAKHPGGSSAGASMEDVDEAISEHALNPDAHHE